MSTSYNLIVDECQHCKNSKKIHLFSITSNGLLLLEGRNDYNKDYVLHDLLSSKYSDFYSDVYYAKYTQIHKISDMHKMIKNINTFYPWYIEDENGERYGLNQIDDLIKQSKKSEALKWVEMSRKNGINPSKYKLVSNYIVWYCSFN